MRHVINVIEGVLMTVMLLFWIGLDFISWNFWGPFIAWALVSSAADVAKRDLP